MSETMNSEMASSDLYEAIDILCVDGSVTAKIVCPVSIEEFCSENVHSIWTTNIEYLQTVFQ